MFRKFLSILLAFSAMFISQHSEGQNLVTMAYREQCDTLRTLIQKRTTVLANFKLESVSRRNGYLDFHFSSGIGDIPWNSTDIDWLKTTLRELSPVEYSHYKIGEIYSGHALIKDLVLEYPGSDGKVHDHRWKMSNTSASPQMVRDEDGMKFSKGLSGKYIALWQSHGRYFEAKTNRWEWQRAPLFTTVEDMYTQSYVLPFLIPMLENSGAYVMTPRERDTQKYEVIVDNDPTFKGERTGLVRRTGKYSESGKWTDAGIGFADFKETYIGNDAPFTKGSVRQAVCTDKSKATAVATWTPDIPERGRYAVYISYKTLANSSESAHYAVKHLGGTSHFLINQKMGGGTWIYLGTFEFDKDSDCKVTLDNSTRSGEKFISGSTVTADAVKFGGGMGKIARGRDDVPKEEWTVSGLPSFTEGALYWMQWAGADTTITRKFDTDYTNDYADRGAWVSMMSGGSRMNPKPKGKGIPFDLSLAFHSDAGITPADSTIGTLSIYTLICEGSRKYATGEDRILGRVLSNAVQSQIISDIRTQYEPNWRRRQLTDRSYSESRTPAVPATLLELLSHQNFADMKFGLDPSFRFTVSRAIYKGILKFLSQRYGFHYCVQPLPIHSFSVTSSGNNAVLSWKPTIDTLEQTAIPDKYILYTRLDDGAFDNGVLISTTKKNDGRLVASVPIEKGHLYSYKIVACNEGGKSFPSETLCIGLADSTERQVLVVNNFDRVAPPAWFDTPSLAGFDDRLDAGVPYINEINRIGEMYQFRRTLPWTDDDNPGFGASYTYDAGKIVQGNTFDFVSDHGKALIAAGYSFCSASADAFETDSLHSYWATDIICGKQITTPAGFGTIQKSRFQVMPEALQKAISTCTANGGNILISGANIGTDLWDEIYPVGRDSLYQANAQKFVKEVLGYKWVTNYAARSGNVRSVKNKKLDISELPKSFAFYQDRNDYIYNVETPDGIIPASNSSFSFLQYTDSDITAGVGTEGKGYRAVSMGFPIETIKNDADKISLFKSVMEFFEHK